MNLSRAHLVLFFTDNVSLKVWHETGMIDREVAIYRALRPHLRKISFVTYGDREDLEFATELGDIEIICNRFGLSKHNYRRYVYHVLGRLWRKPVIMKSNQTPGADLPAVIRKNLGHAFVARCGYMHSEFIGEQQGEKSAPHLQALDLERFVFENASHVMVTTDAMKSFVSNAHEILPENVCVNPNYVVTDVFLPSEQNNRASGRISFVGRFSPQKNVDLLLESVAATNGHIVLFGGGKAKDRLTQLAQKLGADARFCGNLSNFALPGELNKSEIFVLPSNYEGHPKALLEAMSCGLPVIGTNVPGIREVIAHEENGLLCEPNKESLSGAINRLLGDADLREQLGARARTYIEDNYSVEAAAARELDAYRKVLTRP